jgi:hypothetical protein
MYVLIYLYIVTISCATKKGYANNKEIHSQELLTLNTIYPIWAKRLEESKLLSILSLQRLQLYLELNYIIYRQQNV